MPCKQRWGLGVRHLQLFLIMLAKMNLFIFMYCPRLAVQLADEEVIDASTFHEDLFKNTVSTWTKDDLTLLQTITVFIVPVGYFIGGLISVKFNTKYHLLFISLVMALQSLSFPYIVRSKSSTLIWCVVVAFKISASFFNALSESISYQIISHMATRHEYCKASVVLPLGDGIGSVVAFLVTQFAGKYVNGWSNLFYTIGNMSILWSVAWFTFGTSDYRRCFYISTEEQTYIERNTADLDPYGIEDHSFRRPVCWKKIFSSKDFYVLTIVFVAAHAIDLPLITEYNKPGNDKPKMAEEEYKLLVSGVLQTCCTLTVGVMADFIASKKWLTVSQFRKTCNSTGYWGLFIVCILVRYNKTPIWAKILQSIAFSLIPFGHIGAGIAFIEMAPNYAGVIHGLVHSFATITPAAFEAYLYFCNLKADTSEVLNHMWTTRGFLLFFANFLYVLAFKHHTQSWNNINYRFPGKPDKYAMK